MPQLEHLIVRLTMDDRDLERGLQRADSGLQKVSRTAVNVGKGIAAFGAVATGAAVALGKLATEGGRVIQLERAFANRVGDSTAALVGLRKQTQGLVSDTELMRQANQALALGSADNVDQFGEMADVALRLSRALGIDATFALESLNTGIARQSRLYLDNLGIIISVEEANEAYASSLGKAASELSDLEKREAFRVAAMREANKLVESFGEQNATAADDVAQLAAAIANLRDQITELVASSPSVGNFFETWRLILEGAEFGGFGLTGLSQERLAEFQSIMQQTNIRALAGRRMEFIERRDQVRTQASTLSGAPQRRAQEELAFLDRIIPAVERRIMSLAGAFEVTRKQAEQAEPNVRSLSDRIRALGALSAHTSGALVPGIGRVDPAVIDAALTRSRGPIGNMSGMLGGPTTVIGRQRRADGSFGNVFQRVPEIHATIDAMGELAPITEDVTASFGEGQSTMDKFFGGLDSLGGDILSTAAGNLLSGGISAIASRLFGGFSTADSPEEREFKRALENNNQQLERLNNGLARLGTALLGERGGDLARIQAAMERSVGRTDVPFGERARLFETELARLGLTMEDAERIAAGFGIELDGSTMQLVKFKQALQTEFLDQIVNDFSTRMGIMQQMFGILGTDPDEQFEQMRGALIADLIGSGANPLTNPILRGLMGLGSDNFEGFAQSFFDRLLAGDETLLEELGDVSVEEFIRFLGFAGDALGDLRDAASDVTRELRNVPQGFKVALFEFRASDPVVRVPGRTDPDGSRPDVPGTGITITGPVHIHASTYEGGQAAYEGFVDEAERQRRRGGGSALRVVTR